MSFGLARGNGVRWLGVTAVSLLVTWACGSDEGRRKDRDGAGGDAAGQASGGEAAGGEASPVAGNGAGLGGAGAGGTLPAVLGGAAGAETAGGSGSAGQPETGVGGDSLGGQAAGGAGAGGAGAAGAAASNAGDSGAAGAGGAGGVSTQVFASITDLYDAIETAQLGEGDAWQVAWTADARLAEGSISGNISAGVPSPSVFDHGALPLKLFEPSDWTKLTADGTLTFDADGYPIVSLPANAAAGGLVRAKLNHARYAFGRFTLASLRIAQDLSGASPFSGVAFELWDGADQNALVGNHFVEAGGGTMSVAVDYYKDGAQILTNGVGATTSTRLFEGIWNLYPDSPLVVAPAFTMQIRNLQGTALGTDSSAISGQGDWSQNLANQNVPVIRIYRGAGGTNTSTAVGVSFQLTRYTP